jgi:hypothetical protein
VRNLVSFVIPACIVVALVGCGGVMTPTPLPLASPSAEAVVSPPSGEETEEAAEKSTEKPDETIEKPTEEPRGEKTEESVTEEASPMATPVPPTNTPTLVPLPTFTFTPAAEPVGMVNAEPSLNLRSGPGLEHDVIGSLPLGSEVRALGRNEAGDWLKVSTDQGDGWVAAQYVALNVPVDSLPVATEVPSTPVPETTDTPVPTTPTMAAVDAEIEAIMAGEYSQLSPPWEVGPTSAGGKAVLTIVNDTPHPLTVLLGQPALLSVNIAACADCAVYEGAGPESCPEGRPQQLIRLDPGTMKVVIRPDTPDFDPFGGDWGLLGDTQYTYCFSLVR